MLLPLVAAFALGLFYIAGAQAVHDVSVFQLDGDAQVDVGDTQHAEDWDVICEANPSTCTIKSGFETGVVSTASASSHEADGGGSATIFTGGGSKDISGIQSGPWAWKNTGGLPDKDNLLHAYAAKYIVPTSPECVGPGGNTDGTEDCVLIYFGSDRFANDGDATQAFWFLQNKITLGSNKIGGGEGFVGTHTDGDLLIISEFSNGGDKSTITIYRWTGTDATGGLTFVTGGEAHKCGGSTPDAFCGIVNEGTTPIDSPWSFLDKAGSTQFRQGELYEAGINLSDPDIGLAQECFSSFVAETRSSTSTSAELKDFVLGQFEVCVPNLTTQVKKDGVNFNDTVAPGVPVTDTATVTVTGAANPADATGTVDFFLCGPNTSATACTTGGTAAGADKPLTDTSSPANTSDGISGAVSDAVNTSGSPLQPGFYCFRAVADLTNYDDPAEFTNNTTECFRVRDTTAISTAQSWLPQDSATITTGSGAAAPAGTVVFTLYDSNNCTGTVLGTFTDSSSPYTTNNQTTVSVEATKSVSWSATFTPTDTNAFEASTTTRCERSDLTINNSASAFPPPSP
jgi:hypothetical protein